MRRTAERRLPPAYSNSKLEKITASSKWGIHDPSSLEENHSPFAIAVIMLFHVVNINITYRKCAA
jgi:hypothetical protein